MKNIFTTIFITVFSMLSYNSMAQCNFFIPDFNNFNTVGNATIGGGGCYTLTTGYANGGAAWYRDSVNLGYDFDLSFNTYQCGAADGMMFVVQSCSNGATAIGNNGSSLGYYQGSAFNHSLGVEMDIYNSGSGAPYYDPDNSHIAVVKNDDATPLAGPVNISTYLGNCSTRVLRVTWNATTHLFSVYLNNGLITSYTDDLVTDVFAGNPHVYFGFTAGCGGYWATQSFCVNYLHYTPSHVHTNAPSISATSACSGATLSGTPSASSYLWSTGATTSSITSTGAGTYTVTVSDIGGCTASASYAQSAAPGDPSIFGDHVWNVYVWNAGDGTDTGQSWIGNYSGYYVETDLSFNTQNRWYSSSAPSSASGYQGCSVGIDHHSWSAKRQGFDCGNYQINIPSHDDGAQLFVNGSKVWEHIGCCDSHTNVWSGFLDNSSTIEFRCSENGGGSFGSIELVSTTSVITLNGPSTICPGYSLQLTTGAADSYLWNTGETTQAISVSTAGTYSVDVTVNGCNKTLSQTVTVAALDTPVIYSYSGLHICPQSSYVDMHVNTNSRYSTYSWSNGASYYYTAVSSPGNYSVTVSDALGCSATSHAVVTGPPGDESAFGDYVWKVNAYYDGYDYSYYYYYTPGTPWLESNYSGYYVDSNQNFNTESKWNKNNSPSSAPGYQGCGLPSDYFSFSAKRQGFDCGIYQIDIPTHDDNAQLWVDDVMVWEHTGCCDAHTNVWTGVLNSDSKVEFKVEEISGWAFGSLLFTPIQSFNPVTPTISGGSGICGMNPLTLDAGTGFTSYLWSTGSSTQTISTSTAGDYSVKVIDANGCVSSAQTTLTNLTQYTYYADADADTYGNPANSTAVCSSAPSGYVSNNTDCNDASASVHPGANDMCNSIDDNCNGVVDENAISATITPGGNFSFCTGTTVILVSNSGLGKNYQWVKNGKNVSGATQSSYSTKKPANYQVKETNSFGCSSTSATTTLTQVNKPTASITAQGSLDLCGTNSVVLQANTGVGLLYQWVKNAGYIVAATNSSYTATSKGTYKCIVSNSTGCSTTSNGLRVTKSCKVDVSDPDASSLHLYPNPTNGDFVIELTLADISVSAADVQVLNVFGQVMFMNRAVITDGELKVELNLDPNIPSGNYFVRVIAGEKVYSKQFIVQR